MSSFYQSVIGIISKPSENRQDDEVQMILGWFKDLFRKKSAVFGDIKAEVVKDIIKNCSFETKKTDDIIIRQGDIGDCFFINLRGKVSIYINHKKHDDFDENDDINEDSSKGFNETETNLSSSMSFNKSKKFREKLGNYVTSLGAGEGFGEIALVSDDTRSATIIADETTDLMVVNKTLYARCLQAPTLRKLAEKQNFINKSPFFGNWAPKMKKLLSLCLERDIVPYDSFLGKQGETAEKIFFILSGQAKVTVDPILHRTQYPRLYPLKLPENEEQEIISSWIEEKNNILSIANQSLPNTSGSTKNTLTSSQQKPLKTTNKIKRRSETFAEAEQRLKTRNIEVGILGAGEIAGMCEIIFDMSTYMQSTKCIEECDVFYIYKRSYERLIAKRNPTCINKMKETVQVKLEARNKRLKLNMPVELYRSLEYRLELTKRKQQKAVTEIEHHQPTQGTSNTQITLPRGPIVQLDLRPKSAAYYNMLKRSDKQNKNLTDDSIILNSQKKKNDEVAENFVETIESLEELNFSDKFQHNEYHKKLSNGNKSAPSTAPNIKFKETDRTNNLAMEKLENRIKRWHLEFGANKACVAKFNRIDIDKIKEDIKMGGFVYIKRKQTTPEYKNRSRSISNDDSSFSENNSSESCDIDYFSNGVKLNNGFASNNSNNRLNDSRYSQRQLNEIKSNFLSSFFNSVDTESCNEGYELIHIPLNMNANNTNDVVNLNSTIKNAEINGNGNCLIAVPAFNSFLNSSIIQIVEYGDNPNENKLSYKKNDFNDDTLKTTTSFYYNSDHLFVDKSKTESQDNNTQVNETDTNNRDNKNTKKKKSTPNLTYHNNRADFTQINTPYATKRKLSCGQFKIQHTGKYYSKEEYAALKRELKKQTRKYSLTSAKN